MRQSYFILIFFLLISTATRASFSPDSARLDFDFALRERFELWNGMNAKNYGNPNGAGKLNDKMLLQRVVTGLTFSPNSKIAIAAHIQDSRAFGWSLRNSAYPEIFRVKQKNTQEPYYTMNPNEEFFEIYDLYVEAREIIRNVDLKIGRQKISFADNRIFGPGEWGNTGRWTWDALRLTYRKNKINVDVFGGGTKIHDPESVSLPFTQTEHWGGGAYAHIDLGKFAVVEPFYAIKTQGSADYIKEQSFTRHWIGAKAFSDDINHFTYDLTLTREFGSESGKAISAYGLVGSLGYRLHSLPAKPTLLIRESYATGGSNGDAQVKTFDPAFGAKDSYYGRMNITSWSNLDDREIAMYFSPVKGLKVELNFHWFYIPSPADAALLTTIRLQPSKHHLGKEFNIYSSYQADSHLQMVGVFGYFWAGDIQPINGSPAKNSSWFALQALYRLDCSAIGKHRSIN